MMGRDGGKIRVGISGWVYPNWRGAFYPKGLAQRFELKYASERLNSIEINGTFYSLQKPESFAKWRDETPDDFQFAVKGSRFITHIKRMKGGEQTLANYFASGPFALEEKAGPILWQLAPNMPLDLERLEAFVELLPKTTTEAAELAKQHDGRFEGDAWTSASVDRPVRHAFEPRHRSFYVPEVIELFRRHNVALVIADAADRFPSAEDVTADFLYLRLHGIGEIYVGGYTDEALDRWADRIRTWSSGGEPTDARRVVDRAAPEAEPRDVYVYFDNDAKVRAPFDAMSLMRKLGVASVATDVPAEPAGEAKPKPRKPSAKTEKTPAKKRR